MAGDGWESPASFPATQWTLVNQMGDGASEEQRVAALEMLAKNYWYPVYAYVRRSGNDYHDSEDLTQGFFLKILKRDGLGAADRDKGRFRSYLLKALKNYLANEHRREVALKRGGGKRVFSIDSEEHEERFLAEPSHQTTPEVLYQRNWACSLLENVVSELAEEYGRAGKGELFAALRDRLPQPGGGGFGGGAAPALAMSKGAEAKAVYNMRQRYRKLLRESVRQTLHDGWKEDIDEEIRFLLAALEDESDGF